MELIFLGTGTSQGSPIIGCRCPVCVSDDPRDARSRASAAVRLDDGQILLIDTAPELRLQALAVGLLRVDAVLFTHGHADHMMGADDLRAFSQRNGNVIPCHADAATVADLRRVFGYAELKPGEQRHPDRPGLTRHAHAPGERFELLGAAVTPVPLRHAAATILGWRIETPAARLAYCTDCSRIPDESFELLAGLDVLVLGALRRRPHPAHMTLDEALATADRIAARQTWFVHMNHDLPHAATNAALPPDKQLAHDGLVVRVGS